MLPRKGVVQTVNAEGWSWIKRDGNGSRKSGNRVPFLTADVVTKVCTGRVGGKVGGGRYGGYYCVMQSWVFCPGGRGCLRVWRYCYWKCKSQSGGGWGVKGTRCTRRVTGSSLL